MTKTRSSWLWAIAACAVSVLVLAACGAVFTPEQAQTLREVWTQQLADGHLSQSQFDALMGGLEQAQSGATWQEISEIAISVGLSVVAAFTGITLHRGTPSNRKGLAPKASA